MCGSLYKKENVLSGWSVAMVEKQVGKYHESFRQTIKYLCKWLLFLTNLMYVSKIHLQSLTGKYIIKGKIITYSASIFYIEEARKRLPICLKMWRFRDRDDGVYDTTTAEKRTKYTIEGFHFNRQFAPEVYLGIALIGSVSNQYIVIKHFTTQSETIKDLPSRRYAIVMRRLSDERRLDIQLEKGLLDKPSMMKFLAQEIALMHKKLKPSPLDDMGSVPVLKKKLDDNLALLDKIDYLKNRKEEVKNIRDVLLEIFQANQQLFEKRKQAGYIKRCHGDLKPGNLWVQPAQRLQSQKLLALDCIDFDRPDFCHIDTLCDVAMLGIALEHSFALRLGEMRGQKLVKFFLDIYQTSMGADKEDVSFLLDYYMAEKAIVCAYTSDVYDSLSSQVVDIYFRLALTYVRKLKQRPRSHSVEQSVISVSKQTEDRSSVVIANHYEADKSGAQNLSDHRNPIQSLFISRRRCSC